MKRTTMKLLPVAAALAMMGATSAWATEGFYYNGYFRAGPGFSTQNHNRTCFGIPNPDGLLQTWKYRLGNECDYYGELGLNYGIGKDTDPNFQVHWMPNFFTGGVSDAASLGGGPAQSVKTEQLYGEAKNMDFAPGTTFWAGTRFYGRNDVHIIDTFFVNMSGTGGGADIGLGGATLGIAVFRNDSLALTTSDAGSSTGAPGSRLNIDLRDLTIAPNNKLRFTGVYTKGNYDAAHDPLAGTSHPVGGVSGASGYGGGVQWDLDLGGGLKNTVWLQYASGSAGVNMGFGSDLSDFLNVKTYRIVESPQFQFGNIGGQAVIAYTRQKSDNGTAKYLSLGGRVSAAITNNFKLLGEAGWDNYKPTNTTVTAAGSGSSMNMYKVTFAPTVAMDKGFWARPEIRLYVTYGHWNGNVNTISNLLSGGTSGYGDLNNKTSATTYGIQFEGWW